MQSRERHRRSVFLTFELLVEERLKGALFQLAVEGCVGHEDAGGAAVELGEVCGEERSAEERREERGEQERGVKRERERAGGSEESDREERGGSVREDATRARKREREKCGSQSKEQGELVRRSRWRSSTGRSPRSVTLNLNPEPWTLKTVHSQARGPSFSASGTKSSSCTASGPFPYVIDLTLTA
eukprot:3934635-Rhodomonas_salina.1